MRVVYVGNFEAPWSTENDVAWTLEKMGHSVCRVQESISPAFMPDCELIMWTHTHGWPFPEWMGFPQPRVALHLDRFWGLNSLDKREDQIGHHPFWKADFVFTADGGNQHRFYERHVNHFWSLPAVCERWCYKGKFRPEYAVDVAFIGSESYHPEYPFRGKLIQFLRDNYAERFRLIQGVREGELNDLCASVKVIVGDSCFAGAPRYWSDRVPEIIGRGGFLLHPWSEGMTIPMATYARQDLGSLKGQIDWFLRKPELRETYIQAGMAHVAANDTYRNRMEMIFDVVFRTEGLPLCQRQIPAE